MRPFYAVGRMLYFGALMLRFLPVKGDRPEPPSEKVALVSVTAYSLLPVVYIVVILTMFYLFGYATAIIAVIWFPATSLLLLTLVLRVWSNASTGS